MPSATITRPNQDEFAPYYQLYIKRVPQGDLLELLAGQAAETERLLSHLSDERAAYRYAPDKWSVKDVLGHVIDGERVFAYRLLSIARGDTTPLPGYDQDAWVPVANAGRRPLGEMLEEYRAVRAATVHLLRGLDAEALLRRGTANGVGVSARAIAYIITGHERHHLAVLAEKYGVH